MIAHVSIPAKRPQEVAGFLAKTVSGSVFHFPVVDGAFIVVANDNSGMAIEVYPAGMCHHPGRGTPPASSQPTSFKTQEWEDQIFMESKSNFISSHHMALTTLLTLEEVLQLGRELDFRTIVCDRAGVFKLVEIWIDNTFLIEILTTEEAQRYRNFMNPVTVSKMFGSPIQQELQSQSRKH